MKLRKGGCSFTSWAREATSKSPWYHLHLVTCSRDQRTKNYPQGFQVFPPNQNKVWGTVWQVQGHFLDMPNWHRAHQVDYHGHWHRWLPTNCSKALYSGIKAFRMATRRIGAIGESQDNHQVCKSLGKPNSHSAQEKHSWCTTTMMNVCRLQSSE